MTVTLVEASPVDLGETPQPLRVQELDRPLELGEVLLDARIRQLRQRLGSEALDGRSEFAQESRSITSNIRSTL